MLNDLFHYARKNGMVKLEEDVENPDKSPGVHANIRSSWRIITRSRFVCDTLRMAISGGVPAFDLDQMMEMDMDVHHHEAASRSRR